MNATREIELGKLRLGAGNPLFLIAGPCVIETESHARAMAEKIAKVAADAGLPYIFKASFDKANRSSLKGFRGPGLKEGLRILGKIKSDLKLLSSPTSMKLLRPRLSRMFATCSRFPRFWRGRRIC